MEHAGKLISLTFRSEILHDERFWSMFSGHVLPMQFMQYNSERLEIKVVITRNVLFKDIKISLGF